MRLAGDLTGTALSPRIASNSILGASAGASSHIQASTITNANIHTHALIAKSKLAPLALIDADIATGAAIAQSKIQSLQSDLAAKAGVSHTHTIADITNLQAALDAKAATSHAHSIASVTGLQTALDAKAASNHTHTANAISDFINATSTVIGDRIQAGSNVTVDYDSGTGITTINASASGGAGPSSTVTTVAGRTGDVVLAAGDITSGTFTTNRIPNLDASKVTTGTFDVAQLPTGTTGTTVALGNHTHAGYSVTGHTHAAADTTTGTFDIARIPTGTTSTTVALGNHTHTGTYAALTHTHDDRYYTETEVDASLTAKLDASEKGQASGVATLDANGKLPTNQLPALAIKETYTVASQAAMLALSAQRGDMAIRTDTGKTYVLASDTPSTLSDWKEITAGSAAVSSVAGKTGAVTLVKADVGLANVDNTADLSKPVSTAMQGALDAKADISAAQMIVRWNPSTSQWDARPAGAAFGVLFLSTNDAAAPAPNSGQLQTGDVWRRHPDAV